MLRMLPLKQFRDKAIAVADFLNWSHLTDDGIVQGKDGSLLAGWFYRGPDIASSTDGERDWLSEQVNAALSHLGAGWVQWVDAARLPAFSYPPAQLSHFPDPVSRLVEAERRAQFLREGAHFEGEYAFRVQFTPPLRRKGKIADLIYDDDPEAEPVSPASRILDQFKRSLESSRGCDRRCRAAPAHARATRTPTISAASTCATSWSTTCISA